MVVSVIPLAVQIVIPIISWMQEEDLFNNKWHLKIYFSILICEILDFDDKLSHRFKIQSVHCHFTFLQEVT